MVRDQTILSTQDLWDEAGALHLNIVLRSRYHNARSVVDVTSTTDKAQNGLSQSRADGDALRRELEHAKSVRREDHDNAKISEPEDAIVPVQSNIDAFPEDQREAALSVDNEAIKELVEDARRSDWENNRKDFME